MQLQHRSVPLVSHMQIQCWFYAPMMFVPISLQVDRIVKESNKNAGNKKLKDREIKLKENFKR